MQCRAITIRGTVQGVGFRPFVFRVASELGVRGTVRNVAGDVWIHAEGEAARLDRFEERLRREPPPLARIQAMTSRPRAARHPRGFRIEASDDAAPPRLAQSTAEGASGATAAAASGGEAAGTSGGGRLICPDVATCDACLAEMLDPADRRYRYPFTNCTNCGPRLTIIRGTPYDRSRTTMARFAMCDACRAEYENPADRRFHAQPVACPVCGPRLTAVGRDGGRLEKEAALAAVVEAIRAGAIGAVKGLGGYHLACDARDGRAVAALRQRKNREQKPFAVMLPDLAAARACCEVSAAEAELLTSPRRPIVLLRKRSDAGIARGVAPGHATLGVMLPYTPVHHLLMHDLEERRKAERGARKEDEGGNASSGFRLPRSGFPFPALVMTSGNRAHEPIVYRDDQALERLGGIADVILTHDRPIHARCDDSVTRIAAGAPMPIRRSRGDAPQPIHLPDALAAPCPILAVGGQLKNTFALAAGRDAFLSQHMGDLDELSAYRAFERDIDRYQDLLAIEPKALAHDLHPGYASTRYALARARREGLACLGVQHHHAHVAGVLAEHGVTGPVLGVSFDGTGQGTDATVWGGEFLVGDCRTFTRAAHLRRVGMPGGERAVREPWRMAAAHLADAGATSASFERRADPAALRIVRRMLGRGVNCPWTSSAGRLFDAVAAVAGPWADGRRVHYEGQAAIELEQLALSNPPGPDHDPPYPFDVTESLGAVNSEAHTHGGAGGGDDDGAGAGAWEIDTRPLIRAAAHDADHGIEASRIARRFHAALTRIIVTVCQRLREASGIDQVALSGGVFLNALLTEAVEAALHEKDFRVYRNRLVSPGDGGLCLGQAAVAAACFTSPGDSKLQPPPAAHPRSQGDIHVSGHPR